MKRGRLAKELRRIWVLLLLIFGVLSLHCVLDHPDFFSIRPVHTPLGFLAVWFVILVLLVITV
ncbi:MAG TPA: hypothetical protein VM511_13500, partial [Luteolibacter sp.]|nr:hypothetical protein [Luteolibacter sp.]